MGATVDRPEIIRGLEDVYVKESQLCLVDGEKGRLRYVGYDIRDLAERSSFEETAYLLWNLRLPRRDELDRIRRAMGEERKVPKEILGLVKRLPKATVPIDALRTAVSASAGVDPELGDHSRDANLRKALRITAKTATLVAAIERIRSGKRPVAPDPDLGHAEDFLRMLNGKAADEFTAKTMDVALLLHADHSLAASTFAATVAASTLADVYATVVAGLAAFKGPLHGGANEQAVNMLLKIGNPANAEAYIEKALARGEKIPGFGHRVYKTFDPRAVLLKDYAKKLAERSGDMKFFETALAVEDVMIRELAGKRVYPNVDFWAGVTYYELGLPPELFTPIFAVARMSGWTAHVIEYWQTNKIIRPLDFYTGPTEATYVPLDQR